jgi:LCP family protein required for cell wall assembly
MKNKDEMKKKLTIDEIEKSVASTKVQDSATPGVTKDRTAVKFNKRGKKKIEHLKLYIILGVLTLVLGGLGVFGWNLYGRLSAMFGGNSDLLSLFAGQQLKGEDTGRINVLLLGVGDAGHSGENLSDTIMVISYDVKTKQTAMISVPRDLYVKIGDYGSAKINAAHAYGEYYKYTGGGPALAEKTIGEVLGIPINYYARVDFTGLKDIVNAVGGIDINVKSDLYDPYYPSDDGLKSGELFIKKGQQHMNGDLALRYSRSRETTSDFDRARRQQEVLTAIKTKVMSADTLLNPTKISDIATALGKHLKTDFSVSEITRGIEIFKGVDTSKIKNKVFDNSPEGLLVSDSGAAGYILIPRAGMNNYSQLQAVVKNIFNDNSMATENAAISLQNGTTTSGLANKAGGTMTKLGYNIMEISSADKSTYTQTTVIDYTNGANPGTISALEKLFKVTATKGVGKSATGAEIEVILGANYTGI